MDCRELNNWGPDKRILILPQDSFDIEKQPLPSAGDVISIKVRDCPDGKSCVQVENNGNTSLCPYMRAYPDLAIEGTPGLQTVVCDHPRASAHLEVASLTAYCPTDTKACIRSGAPCPHLENVLTPEQVLGPHYHVMCAKMP
jgi:hypothetical protein